MSMTKSMQRPSRMIPRLIKTEEEYETALHHVDALMSAEAGTSQMEELELWVHLVQAYEKKAYPVFPPDPVAGIRFKMEQQGLRPSDLVPYIGSKSKVSEVLARKRGLSLAMIRKLHVGLGIPAAVLIQDAGSKPSSDFDDVDWRNFPLAAMVKRRWFGDAVTTSRQLFQQAEELLGGLLKACEVACPEPVALRQSAAVQNVENSQALRAWRARVWQLAQEQPSEPFIPDAMDKAFISQIARLSVLDNGPVVAREVLSKVGIKLATEPQLPGTRLDGAAMMCTDGCAIIGLTLRYDRLDHFWFTLCHELAHLALHLKDGDSHVIMDDLESEDRTGIEGEADRLAAEALIPPADWSNFSSQKSIAERDIISFARRQRLHPSVVAGRIRRESADYKRFGSLLGNRKVRSLFLSAADA